MFRGGRVLAAVFVAAVLLVSAGRWLAGRVGAEDRGAEDRGENATPGSGDHPVEIVRETAAYRVVRHAAGTAQVPVRPRRICALASADELLSIGVTPIAHSIDDGNFPDYLKKPLAGVPWIPNVYGAHLPNMEAVIAVRPDLIFSSTQSPQTYQQLSRIAPVVVLRNHLEHYRQRVLDVGAVVGRTRQAKARVAWYDAKVRAARAALHAALGHGAVAFLRVRPTSYRLHGGDHHIDPVLYDDLGVRRPNLIQNRAWSSTTSPEGLLRLDAEFLLVAVDVAIGSRRSMSDLLSHPVWRRVPAVRKGHVSVIDQYRHWADSGILGRARSIDDVVRAIAPHALAGVDAQALAALHQAPLPQASP